MLTDDGKHLYVSWDEYHLLIERLALKVHGSGWEFDQILCLARGGLRPGDVLSRVFDKPLAIMDASTISPDDVTTVKAKTNVLGKTQHLMFAFPKWSAVHKWYYYSYQTPSEMLLFHHYNRDKTNVWGNPHSSFTVSGCGDEHESRKSIEMRFQTVASCRLPAT